MESCAGRKNLQHVQHVILEHVQKPYHYHLTEIIMKSSDIRELTKELDIMISYYRHMINLFQGGCCFTAACICEELEKRNISYKIISFSSEWIVRRHKSIRTIANENNLGHVAVMIGRTIIGGGDGFGFCTPEEQGCVSSSELLDIYNTNQWNSNYDKRHNRKLKREIKELFNMFD